MFKEKILVKFLQYGVYVFLFTPLVISCNTIYPFIFGRVLLMQTIIGVLFGVWLILIYLYPKYKPKKNLITTALLVYFGIILFASLFSVDFLQSFWGNTERMGGIFTYLHFLALFFVLQTVFRGWKEWKNFFIVSLFASSLMCVVALLQRDGIALIDLCGVEKTRRVTGTADNPIFFAAYLMFHIFIAGLLVIKTSVNKIKIPVILLGLLNIITFILTESKGALMAIVVSLFLLFLGYIYLSKGKKIKITLMVLILVAVISVSLIYTFRDAEIFHKNLVISHLVSISLTEGTASTRMLAWGVAFEAWKEKPILGWGWDNFFIGFNKYYNPELLSFSLYETWFDRAHNILFDQLVMIGLFGLLSYLFVFVAVFLMLLKLFRQKIVDKHVFIFTCAIFVSYFVQNLFAFDSPSTLLMFFSFLAFIISVSKEPYSKNEEMKKPLPIIVFSLFICLFSIMFNYHVYSTNAETMLGIRYAYKPFEERKNIILASFKEWTPYKEELRLDLLNDFALELLNGTISKNKVDEYFKEVEAEILENIKRHPENAFYPFALGRLYSTVYEYDVIKYSEYLKKSEESFKKALEFSPKRQQVYYGLGKLYLVSENEEKMREAYTEMMNLNPDASDPYWFLGVGLLRMGFFVEGNENVRNAVGRGFYPRTADDITIISNAYVEVKEYDPLIKIYEGQIVEDSAVKDMIVVPHADFCAKVAIIYAEKGEKEKAREAALRAASLDPSFQQEAEVFIKMLGF